MINSKSVLAIITLIFANQTSAAIVHWEYSGTITNVDTAFTSLYVAGDNFSGYFDFDTTTPMSTTGFSLSPSDQVATYNNALVSASISIGSYSLTYGIAHNSLLILNDYTDTTNLEFLGDGLLVSTAMNEADALTSPVLSLSFIDSSGSVFNSTALHSDAIDASLFNQMALIITDSNGSCDVNNICDIGFTIPVEGTIDSVTVSSVPVPAAAWLFITGLVSLLGAGIRKSKSI